MRALQMQGTVEFAYIRKAAHEYGTLYFSLELDAFVREATNKQLQELESAYEEIRRRGDVHRITLWREECLRTRANLAYDEFTFSEQVSRLFVLFRCLGEHKIAPFSSNAVGFERPARIPNWDHLPKELEYLREPATTYGKYTSEQQVLAFLDQARPEDLDALARTAERIRLNDHNELINEWFDRFPFDKHQESWLVYWLFGVMDHAGLQWT
jgi:hypothetical protein